MRLRLPGATNAKAPEASTGSDDGGAIFRRADGCDIDLQWDDAVAA